MIAYAKLNEFLNVGYILNGFNLVLSFRCHLALSPCGIPYHAFNCRFPQSHPSTPGYKPGFRNWVLKNDN